MRFGGCEGARFRERGIIGLTADSRVGRTMPEPRMIVQGHVRQPGVL